MTPANAWILENCFQTRTMTRETDEATQMLCSYQNTSFNTHTYTHTPTAVLSGRDVGALAATETHRFNLESCDTALYAPEHAARKPLFNNLCTPTAVSLLAKVPLPPSFFIPDPNLCCLNWVLQLALAPRVSRSSWSHQKKPPGLKSEGSVILKTALSSRSRQTATPPLPRKALVSTLSENKASRGISWDTWISIWFGDDIEVHLKLHLFLFKSESRSGDQHLRPSSKHLSVFTAALKHFSNTVEAVFFSGGPS